MSLRYVERPGRTGGRVHTVDPLVPTRTVCGRLIDPAWPNVAECNGSWCQNCSRMHASAEAAMGGSP